MRFWSKPSPKVHTACGEFVLDRGDWQGHVETPSGKILVVADDVAGAPNPQLMAMLPGIVSTLPRLEAAARSSPARLTAQHQLDTIEDDDDGVDFSLVFTCDEDDCDETVYVSFKDSQIVNWRRED